MNDENTIPTSPQQDADNERVLSLATEAGHLLLENGAEISRVEETMERIAAAYGVDDRSFFVLSNGLIVTGHEYARAQFIPIKGTHLERVVEMNQLSRDISARRCSIAEAEDRLATIRNLPAKPLWEQVGGIALGVGGFCIIFGGSLMDATVTFALGILLGLFMSIASPHMSRIFANTIGGLIGGLLCIAACGLVPYPLHLPNMIIGTIIALVPGVPFTNGIRDMANEDYIAGATRLLDAFMIFLCIALGVVLSFIIDGWLGGGIMQITTPAVDATTSALWIQATAALLGTLGFSALFGVPRQRYLDCGIVGAAGWLVYQLLLTTAGATATAATLGGALMVAIASHLMALWRHCPTTVFLISGIIPLVPGGGIFWTAYYLVSNQLTQAGASGFTALKATIAIAMGIIVAGTIFNIIIRLRKKAKRVSHNRR